MGNWTFPKFMGVRGQALVQLITDTDVKFRLGVTFWESLRGFGICGFGLIHSLIKNDIPGQESLQLSHTSLKYAFRHTEAISVLMRKLRSCLFPQYSWIISSSPHEKNKWELFLVCQPWLLWKWCLPYTICYSYALLNISILFCVVFNYFHYKHND